MHHTGMLEVNNRSHNFELTLLCEKKTCSETAKMPSKTSCLLYVYIGRVFYNLLSGTIGYQLSWQNQRWHSPQYTYMTPITILLQYRDIWYYLIPFFQRLGHIFKYRFKEIAANLLFNRVIVNCVFLGFLFIFLFVTKRHLLKNRHSSLWLRRPLFQSNLKCFSLH